MQFAQQLPAATADSYYSHNRFRSSLAHFIFGKAATSVLGFAVFLFAVRLLSIQDYGAYVALLAMADLVLALSMLGLDWVGLRWLPEYRLCAMKSEFVRFTVQLLLLRLATLLVAYVLLLLLSGHLLLLLHLTAWRSAFMLYAAIIVIEGCAGFMRDVMFVALLQQGRAQTVLLARNAVFISLLLPVWFMHVHISLAQFVTVELKAVLAGMVLGVILLVTGLYGCESGERQIWSPPGLSALQRTAWDNWVSQLLSLAYSSQVLVMLLIRMVGPAAAASYGFARSLVEQVRKYLPSELFIGLIRPMVVASYTRNRSFALLNDQVNLVFNISLFIFVPIFLMVLLYGQAILKILTNGKYGDARWLVVGLLAWVIPFIGRKMFELIVNIVQQTALWRKAALYSVLLLPLAVLGLDAGMGAWVLIAIGLGTEIISILLMVRGLRLQGWTYHLDGPYLMKLMIGAGVSCGLLQLCDYQPVGWAGIVLVCFVTTATWLLVTCLIKPFATEQREKINRLLKRRFFIW